MASRPRNHNLGAKRLMLEAQELRDKTEDYSAQPLEDDLFEWHFTVRGPPDTAFAGGLYHGRLSFPTEYPMKPPSIILLTPNGRFSVHKKICLSISGYHPEMWQPSWSVRTALLALIAFMPSEANGAIGALDASDSERRRLAAKSKNWSCEVCGPLKNLLKKPSDLSSSSNDNSSSCKSPIVNDLTRTTTNDTTTHSRAELASNVQLQVGPRNDWLTNLLTNNSRVISILIVIFVIVIVNINL